MAAEVGVGPEGGLSGMDRKPDGISLFFRSLYREAAAACLCPRLLPSLLFPGTEVCGTTSCGMRSLKYSLLHFEPNSGAETGGLLPIPFGSLETVEAIEVDGDGLEAQLLVELDDGASCLIAFVKVRNAEDVRLRDLGLFNSFFFPWGAGRGAIIPTNCDDIVVGGEDPESSDRSVNLGPTPDVLAETGARFGSGMPLSVSVFFGSGGRCIVDLAVRSAKCVGRGWRAPFGYSNWS